MKSPRAIETRYKGYRFRSRLEARWAVFFDVLGIRWEYEPDGYVIGGTPYLPDFKLLHPNEEETFAEVKGGNVDMFEGDHVRLCRGLANLTGHPVILLTGEPALRLFNCVAPGMDERSFWAVFFDDYTPKRYRIADDYWFQQTEFCKYTGAQVFGHHLRNERSARKTFGLNVLNAIASARAARFEHGESPTEVHLPRRE
ncbi:hypothetical protein IU433_04690 [Nocardia puris]|uniref:hypothetical protein n=1 Tax=Nocardia puris TaxID=208602 RepID=UPI001895E526|nr:hypothetical protein [Nocardia puris]MBF6458340.1 hypothetical protein [Nocardia puris]